MLITLTEKQWFVKRYSKSCLQQTHVQGINANNGVNFVPLNLRKIRLTLSTVPHILACLGYANLSKNPFIALMICRILPGRTYYFYPVEHIHL